MLRLWLILLAVGGQLGCCGFEARAQDTTAAAPTAPSYEYDRDCMDEYGRDLCEARVLKAIVESFGVAPAEELPPNSGIDLRVFTIDGYSQDKPALVFSGLRGPAPRVDILVAGNPAKPGSRRFSLDLTRDEVRRTRDLIGRVRRAPLTAANVMDVANKAKSGDVSELVICGHAWATVLEVFQGGRLTRRIRNTCQTDGIADVALRWGDWVLERLPQCHPLKGGPYRNSIVVVETCATLSGDLASAATVRRIADSHDFRAPRQAYERELSDLLLDRARLRLPDKVVGEAARIREALRSFDGVPHVTAVHGVSPDEATVTGDVTRHDDGVRPVVQIIYAAPMTQRWVRTAEAWRLAEIEIGVYAERDRWIEAPVEGQPATAPPTQQVP